MELRKLGKTKIKTSKICLGTWSVGGGSWWGPSDDDESIRAIRASVDGGISFIDTAPVYGFGHSEEILGKAIKGIRDKVVLSTKCGLLWDGDEGEPFFELDGYSVRRSLQPATIRRELEASLKRLGTDYIDLYITHWPEVGDSPTPVGETMACLMDLKKEGKIKAIGASNVSIEDIQAYSENGQLDVIQERYTMLDRHLEPEYVAVAEKFDISIMTYATIEMGLLTGGIRIDDVFGEDEWRNNLPWFKKENRQKVLGLLENWEDLKEKYDASLVHLVIAWTSAQKRMTFPIVGARKEKHAIENCKAGDLKLEDADIRRMRQDVEALGEPVE